MRKMNTCLSEKLALLIYVRKDRNLSGCLRNGTFCLIYLVSVAIVVNLGLRIKLICLNIFRRIYLF